MQTFVADHPLVAHKLTTLRDASTPTHEFRRLADELVTLLAYEATRHLQVDEVDVETPVTTAKGVKLAGPAPMIVPVLRAGIGMLDGFVGLARDEKTLVASTYAERLPADLTGREIFVLDPMLATGGTLEIVIRLLLDRGAAGVTAVCLLAAPEGLERISAAFPPDTTSVPIRVVTGALDIRLNEHGYIVPGLGDAGDRLFGAV